MIDQILEEGARFFNMKRYDIALEKFTAINTEKLPAEIKLEIIYYEGLCYTKLEQYEEALLLLEQVVTSSEQPVRIMQCRLALAYIYLITKRAKMAEFELSRLQKSGIESVQLYSMLAYVSWQQGDNEKAIELYEKALSINSNNLTAMNSLGYILVDSGKNVKRGLELCRKAAQQKPQNAAYLDSLGWAYFKLGDSIEARNILRRALEISPRQKEITSHMKKVIGVA